jgi:DNA-binding MarR family transcriptional regulator
VHERRPDEAADRLLRLMPRFQQWAAASLRASREESDPSFRQLAMLYLIQSGITSPAMLAEQMGISRAVVTGLLDRMEERDLVRREPDPSDRRRLRVVVTPAGVAAGQRLGRNVTGALADQLAHESPADLAALAAALPLLERTIDALRERTPAAPASSTEGDPWEEPAAPPGPPGLSARSPAP